MESGYFAEGPSAFEIGEVVVQAPRLDEDPLFGVSDAELTAQGYLVADAGNDRLALFDHNLNLLQTTGREGEGPGEYGYVPALASAGSRIAVLDQGRVRVSYVEHDGTFLESTTLRSNPTDVAWHPELGILVADDGSRSHYLSQLHQGGQADLAPIPPRLRPDDEDAFVFRRRTNLVAVAPDGAIHVFDGSHLALISYAPDGALLGANFLPEPARSEKLRGRDEQVEAFGGPSIVLNVIMATTLQPLDDGRLFVDVSSFGGATGYVLDPASLEATPVVFADGHEGRRWGASILFQDDRVLLYNIDERWGVPQLILARVELVQR